MHISFCLARCFLVLWILFVNISPLYAQDDHWIPPKTNRALWSSTPYMTVVPGSNDEINVINIWWPNDCVDCKITAGAVLNLLVAYRMYEQYRDLLLTIPIDDKLVDDSLVDPNLRDANLAQSWALDIVVTDSILSTIPEEGQFGKTAALYPPGPVERPSPARIYLSSKLGEDFTLTKHTVAHELFHAFQFSFTGDCLSQECIWLLESTAEWAVHFIFPKQVLPSNHGGVSEFLGTLDRTLTDPGPHVRSHGRNYGSWPLWHYWQTRFGKDTIRKVFESVRDHDTVLRALEKQKLVGEEEENKENWRKALIYLSNDPDLSSMEQDTGMTARAAPLTPTPIVLAEPTQNTQNQELPGIADTIPPLSVRTFWLSFPDDTVRTITFYNGIHSELTIDADLLLPGTKRYTPSPPDVASDFMQIQFLHRLPGGAFRILGAVMTPGDLVKNICRDIEQTHFSDVKIMVINSSIDKEFRVKGLPPLFRATNIGCWRWKGYSKTECLLDGGPAKKEYVADRLVFEAPKMENDYNNVLGLFSLLSGNLEATASGTNTGGGHTYEYNGKRKGDLGPGFARFDLAIDSIEGGTWSQRVFGSTSLGLPPGDWSYSVKEDGGKQEWRGYFQDGYFFMDSFLGGVSSQKLGPFVTFDGTTIAWDGIPSPFSPGCQSTGTLKSSRGPQ